MNNIQKALITKTTLELPALDVFLKLISFKFKKGCQRACAEVDEERLDCASYNGNCDNLQIQPQDSDQENKIKTALDETYEDID